MRQPGRGLADRKRATRRSGVPPTFPPARPGAWSGRKVAIVPEAAERIPTASVAERFRVLGQRFRAAPESSTGAALRKHLDAICATAGWLLIEAFRLDLIPVRDEWRLHIERCREIRAYEASPDANRHDSNKVAATIFRRVIVEWLSPEKPESVQEAPPGLIVWVDIQPNPDGKTADELFDRHHDEYPENMSIGTAAPSSDDLGWAQTFADACEILAVLAGNGAAVQRHIDDDELPAVDDDEAKILLHLNANALRLQTNAQIEGGTRLGKRAVMNGLNRLIELGLADRTKGPNDGTAIISKGRAWVAAARTTRAPK